ncbi:MAG: kelch repeat-containing protein [Bacteroidia bacterium]
MISQHINAQIWTGKGKLPGGSRAQAVSLTINGKGYLGTGCTTGLFPTGLNDWWEYDTLTQVWSQKAVFPGKNRYGAAGFVIGNKGYVGTGYSTTDSINGSEKDFWEYNPSTNTWTQRADFAGPKRLAAVGFAIGNKGYIALGYDDVTMYKDMYVYDAVLDIWTSVSDFGGTARFAATAFVVGNYAYVGTGRNLSGSINDIWRYNPADNSWTFKTTYQGGTCFGAISFVLMGKAYVANGTHETAGSKSDFYQFDTATNIWTKMENIGARYYSSVFVLGGKAFLCGGEVKNNQPLYGDFWEFDPGKTTQWVKKSIFLGPARFSPVHFVIGNKVYMGGGQDLVMLVNRSDFWEFNSVTGTWSQKANMPGYARYNAISFSIDNLGYMGMGNGGPGANLLDDFWQYNPATNSWTQKAILPEKNEQATAFSIQGNGYFTCGTQGNKRTWEYVPALNTWTRKADYTGTANSRMISFVIDHKAYVGLGILSGVNAKDFWEFDPAQNNWTRKADFPARGRIHAAAFSMDQYGYVGAGKDDDSIYRNDMYRYHPLTNVWEQIPSLNANMGREGAFAFGVNFKGYIGNGSTSAVAGINDMWEFNPYTFIITRLSTNLSCTNDSINITYRVLKGATQNLTFQLSGPDGNFANPIHLQTKSSGIGLDSIRIRIPLDTTSKGTGYRIRVVSNADTSNRSEAFSINTATLISDGPLTFCSGGYARLSLAQTGSGMHYRWRMNGVNTPNAGDTFAVYKAYTTGAYSLRITTAVCTFTSNDTLVTNNGHPIPKVGFRMNDTIQCTNTNRFIFEDTTTISSGSFTRLWSFNNGDTSTLDSIVRSYADTGSYFVRMVTTSDKGCTDSSFRTFALKLGPKVGYTINNDSQCNKWNFFVFSDTSNFMGLPFGFRSWDFGDATGTYFSVVNKGYAAAGNYSVKLRLGLANGCVDSVIKPVTVWPSPKVGFSINDSKQCIYNNYFEFEDTSNIAYGTLTRYWNLEEGDTSTLLKPSKVFTIPGTYPIKLILTSDLGCRDTLTKSVTILSKPAAVITALGPTSFCDGLSVGLQANDISAATYQWLRNDSLLPANAARNAMVDLAGNYRVIVKTEGSCVDTSGILNVVVYPKAKGRIVVNDSTQCFPENQFAFVDSGYITSGTYSRKWDIPTKSNSDTTSATMHVFANPGNYDIKLVLTSDKGCKDSVTRMVSVHPRTHMGSISGNINVTKGTNDIYTVNKHTNASYYWYSISGNIVSGGNSDSVTIHWNGMPGLGRVLSWMNDSLGCITDTVSLWVNITNPPVPDSLSIEPDSFYFVKDGSKADLNIFSNRSWIFQSVPGWISLSPPFGSFSQTVEIKAAKNMTDTARKAVISVVAGNLRRDFIVMQEVGSSVILSIDRDSIYFTNTGGETILQITSNASWNFQSVPYWLSFNPVSGSMNQTVAITATKNLADTIRKALVAVVSGNIKKDFIVMQQKGINSGLNQRTLESGLSLIPNPTTGMVWLTNETGSEILQVEIFEISGKKINTIQFKSNTLPNIDFSAYQNGTYLVTVSLKNGFYQYLRLIVNR